MAIVMLLLACSGVLAAGGWDKEKAAQYLDQREREWFAFQPAEAPHGPCVSCHTNVLYLMARPALRRALRDPKPTDYEMALRAGLAKRIQAADGRHMFPGFTREPLATQSAGVEAVIAAFVLRDAASLDRMWATQIQEGKDAGTWKWFDLALNPWESRESNFFGAALAAVAASETRGSPKAALEAYIAREQAAQPLHHRLTLLWVAKGLKPLRRQIAVQILAAQQPDGGWTVASLGPWAKPLRKPSESSDNYATALATYSLLKTGAKPSDPRVARALDWLEAHQDPVTGIWTGQSMNKDFKPGSMPSQFMNDAATSFAVLALLEGGR
jgi:squalene-hopene/tetraprenyl-beta-curcumene cyclase